MREKKKIVSSSNDLRYSHLVPKKVLEETLAPTKCKTVEDLTSKCKSTIVDNASIAARFHHAALKLDDNARAILAKKDPAANMLKNFNSHRALVRHVSTSSDHDVKTSNRAGPAPGVSSTPTAATTTTTTTASEVDTTSDEPAGDFVSADSIQSTLSPAAYLKYLWDMAADITPNNTTLRLENRRPDLNDFKLTLESLDDEIPTISIVNEILAARLESQFVGLEPFTEFRTTYHPLSLPFFRENCQVRENLKSISDFSLNQIGRRGRQDEFPMYPWSEKSDYYTLVPDPPNRLRLYDAHVSMLKKAPADNTELYGSWFGMSNVESAKEDLQTVDNFTGSVDITFDEYRSMVSDDYRTIDEANEEHENIFGRFACFGWRVTIFKEEEIYKTRGKKIGSSGEEEALSSTVHEFQNKCIRLQKRNGLSFPDLGWLLLNALFSHPDYTSGEEDSAFRKVLEDEAELTVLAHFLEYQNKFELSADEFAAFLADVNCYARAGSENTSLMKTLFGSDAPVVTERTRRYGPVDQVTVGDLEKPPYLGDMLRRGLQVTRMEWHKLLGEVKTNDSETVDSLMVGRMFRLSKLFRLLEWDLVNGVNLLRTIDTGTMDILGRDNTYNNVLSALDRVCALADWMKEFEFEVSELLAVLTDPSSVVIIPSQATLAWVGDFAESLLSAAVVATDFQMLTEWPASGTPGEDFPTTAEDVLNACKSAGVVDENGIVSVDDDTEVETKVTEQLKLLGVDTDDDGAVEQIQEVVRILAERRSSQNGAVDSHVASQVDVESPSVRGMLAWMSVSYYEYESIILAWSSSSHEASKAGIELLFNTQRYATVVNKFEMSTSHVEMMTDARMWSATPPEDMSLQQVFLISSFKAMQSPRASVSDWKAYFAKVLKEIEDNDGTPPEDQSENHEIVSRFLNWPKSDIEALAVADGTFIENRCLSNVQQVSYVSRRVAVCQDASMSAAELMSLEAVIDLQESGNEDKWQSASASAKAAAKRYENGKYVQGGEMAVEEESRDALLDSFVSKVMEPNISYADPQKREKVYQYLLLDVNVSGSVPTTRMLENIGSIQLYINRAVLGLDVASIENKEAFVEKWEIAQQYRVWEAQELLALYPGNYVEPELRLGKSSMFREFEQAVSGGTLNDELLEVSLRSYMQGVVDMGDLTIIAIFPSYEGNDRRTIYVTAQSESEINGFYLREITYDELDVSDGSPRSVSWGDWAKPSLPFASETIYGVIPMIGWSQLYMFWMEVSEEMESLNDGSGGVKSRYFLTGRQARRNADGSYSQAITAVMEGGDSTRDRYEITDPMTSVGGDWSKMTMQFAIPTLETTETTEKVLTLFNINIATSSGWERSMAWELNRYEQRSRVLVSPSNYEWTMESDRTPDVDPYSAIKYLRNTAADTGELSYVYPHEMLVETIVDDIRGSDLNGYKVETRWMKDAHNIGNEGFEIKSATSENGRVQLTWALVALSVVKDRVSFFAKTDDNPPGEHAGNLDVRLGAFLFCRINSKSSKPKNLYCEFITDPDLTNHFEDDSYTPSRYYETTLLDPFAADVVMLPGLSQVVMSTRFDNEIQTYPYLGYTATKYVDHTDTLRSRWVAVLDTIYSSTASETRGANYFLCSDVTLPAIDTTKHVFPVSSNFPISLSNLLQTTLEPSLIFNIANQVIEEPVVGTFIKDYEEELGVKVSDPIPPATLDFNGSYGLYAWELFYHIPELIASKYRQQSEYTEAMRWHKMVFDPSLNEPWKVIPLIDDIDIPSSEPIYDPDEAAKHHPSSYRLASLRYNIETMVDQGDYYYRLQTAETLRQAKMSYVAALSLFDVDEVSNLGQATQDTWENKTLGEVENSDFRPPVNKDWVEMYETIQERLYNLRHWLSIDGEPLNIPLIAAPIDPRVLQEAALAAEAASMSGTAGGTGLPYTYDTAYAKAKEAVESLMYFGDLMTRALRDRDVQKMQLIEAEIASVPDTDALQDDIDGLGMELDVLEKDKEEADTYHSNYSKFADEFVNVDEGFGFALSSTAKVTKAGALIPISLGGGLGLVPKIFGLAFGGSKIESSAEAMATYLDVLADIQEGVAESLFQSGEYRRRQDENKMERDATQCNSDSIQLAIEKLKEDILAEERKKNRWVDIIAGQQRLIDFQKNRTTNGDFYNWYVGRIQWLYKQCYDQAIKFCRLAQSAYDFETTTSGTNFIQPIWDNKYFGLLSGQSLMLNLQKMDYSFLEKYKIVEDEEEVRVSSLSPTHVTTFKETGMSMFQIGLENFEDGMPDSDRLAIKTVRVELIGDEDEVLPLDCGVSLSLVGHRFAKNKSSRMHIFGRQKVVLRKGKVDTAEMEREGGKPRPFERCGLESTWKLSVPSLQQKTTGKVGASSRGKKEVKKQMEKLKDVVFHFVYTGH